MNGQRLRPLGLGDIFDEGFDLYKRNFVFLLLVCAVTIVPLDILFAWAEPRLLPPILDEFGVTRSDKFWLWFFSGLLDLTLFLPVYAIAVAPLVAAASARYLEAETSLWAVYRQFLRRLPGLILLALLGGLALALSLLGCGVIWLVVASQFLLALHAFVIENKGPGKALSRSSSLAGGYGGRAFNCLFFLGLISSVIGLGLRLPLSYLFGAVLNTTPVMDNFYGGGVPGAGQSAEGAIISLVSGGLTHLLLLPFTVCVLTVLYYDMRIRKEGFDVELLAQGLNYPPLTALGAYLPPAAVYGPIRPVYAPPPPQPRQGGQRR